MPRPVRSGDQVGGPKRGDVTAPVRTDCRSWQLCTLDGRQSSRAARTQRSESSWLSKRSYLMTVIVNLLNFNVTRVGDLQSLIFDQMYCTMFLELGAVVFGNVPDRARCATSSCNRDFPSFASPWRSITEI